MEARLDRHVTATKAVDATKGGTATIDLVLAPEPVPTATATATAPPPRSQVPAFVMGGAAVASFIAGSAHRRRRVEEVEADNLQGELLKAGGTAVCKPPASDPKCDSFRDALAARQTLGNAGGWTLIAGGALTVGAVTYVLITRSFAPPPVEASVFVGPDGGGATLRASF
ncbi:MAG: hypothetical protein R3B70_45230 [Polyangiaceae bacterium]